MLQVHGGTAMSDLAGTIYSADSTIISIQRGGSDSMCRNCSGRKNLSWSAARIHKERMM